MGWGDGAGNGIDKRCVEGSIAGKRGKGGFSKGGVYLNKKTSPYISSPAPHRSLPNFRRSRPFGYLVDLELSFTFRFWGRRKGRVGRGGEVGEIRGFKGWERGFVMGDDGENEVICTGLSNFFNALPFPLDICPPNPRVGFLPLKPPSDARSI